MRANPNAVLEGLLIAAEAVGAHQAFVALKASFETEVAAVRRPRSTTRGGWQAQLTEWPGQWAR